MNHCAAGRFLLIEDDPRWWEECPNEGTEPVELPLDANRPQWTNLLVCPHHKSML